MKLNTKNLIISATIFAIGAIAGCKKDTPAPTNATSPSNPQGITTLAAFYNTYGVQAQSFTVNNNTGATIVGAKGGKYFFPANFFQTQAKTSVSGNVTIQLKEIFTPANMLLSNMATTAGNRGLLSEGEFNVHATQGNQTLIPNGVFTAHLPVVDSTPQVVDSPAVWNFINNTWGNSYGSYAYNLGTAPDSVCINSDSINWINADCFYPGVNYYQVTLNAPSSPNINQTAIYIYVNGHKAIWQTSYTGSNQFQTPGDIPAGAPLTIVGLCTAANGTVYSFFLPYTNPGNNDNVTVNFTATTAAAFTAQLSALH